MVRATLQAMNANGPERDATLEELMDRISVLGRLADATLAKDPAAAETMAQEEYALYLAAEATGGERLHKGHPLHNIGVAIYAARPDEARTYFHAAHAEDVRTYNADDPGLLARRMLLDLFGESVPDLDELAKLAISAPDEDPLSLARRFEEAHGPFEAYQGLLEGWRKASDLGPFERHELIFCAGAHSQPQWLKAIADGVRDAGLQPVVVMEFEDLEDENEWDKSLRLLDRCGLSAFDMTVPAGQVMEMAIAFYTGKPFFYGFHANDPLDKPHGSRMPPGAAESSGTKPAAFRTGDELRMLVRRWVEREAPIAALAAQPKAVYLQGPEPGAKRRFSGPPLLPEQPSPTMSGGSAHADLSAYEWPPGKNFEFIGGDGETEEG